VSHLEVPRTYTKEAVETLAEIMRNEKSPPAARVAAANGLLDRGYGKPPQALEHSSSGVVLQVLTGILRAPDEPLEAGEAEGPPH
jgi:hypothetical protein